MDAVLHPEGFAQTVEKVDKPHTLLGRVLAQYIPFGAGTDVGVHVDDIPGLAANGSLDFLKGRDFLGLCFGNVKESHSGGSIDRKHGAGKAECRLEELTSRQLGLGRDLFHMVLNLATILARPEEGGT